MRIQRLLVWGILIVAVVSLGVLLFGPGPASGDVGNNKVLVVRLYGAIEESGMGILGGGSITPEFVANSSPEPGGSSGASCSAACFESRRLHRGVPGNLLLIARFPARRRLYGIAASGGYYTPPPPTRSWPTPAPSRDRSASSRRRIWRASTKTRHRSRDHQTGEHKDMLQRA